MGSVVRDKGQTGSGVSDGSWNNNVVSGKLESRTTHLRIPHAQSKWITRVSWLRWSQNYGKKFFLLQTKRSLTVYPRQSGLKLTCYENVRWHSGEPLRMWETVPLLEALDTVLLPRPEIHPALHQIIMHLLVEGKETGKSKSI